jgi:hypothetical protein
MSCRRGPVAARPAEPGPTSLLYVAVFGDLLAFGTWGALLGPLVLRLWLEALAIDRELRASDAVSTDRGP